MSLSRLRLRLAAGFSIAFLIALGILTATALGYLWHESNRRLDTRLAQTLVGVQNGLARELGAAPDSSLGFAAHAVLNAWPQNDDQFIIANDSGAVVAARADQRELPRVLVAWPHAVASSRFDVTDHHDDLRAFAEHTVVKSPRGRVWRFHVIAFSSIEGIEADTKVLGGALGLAAPLILLVSLAAGYALSYRALRPVRALGASIAAIVPGDLSQRLPVDKPQDETGVVAAEFNLLLDRLDAAERRNRGFVREAAHQIRTPLTLVLGESEHALAASRTPEELAAALGKVRVAAEQMRRRVDELFLLAESQAGEPVHLDENVELDSLVFETTDLMRRRAGSLGRVLVLGDVAHLTMRGNSHLMREAMLELLENACRHGDASAPVVTSVQVDGDRARIIVRNAAQSGADVPHAGEGQGLGLAIVRWIATSHGGALTHERAGRDETYTMDLPRLR